MSGGVGILKCTSLNRSPVLTTRWGGVGVLGPCLREEGVCLGVGLSKGKGMGIASHTHPLPLEGT